MALEKKVESANGGVYFKGLSFISGLFILSGLGISYALNSIIRHFPLERPFDSKLLLVSVLVFIINICALIIIRMIRKKRISNSGIEDCVRSSKNDELKSKIALDAINEANNLKNHTSKVNSILYLMAMALAILTVFAPV